MKILIVNLYSARNLGDDAILYETLRGLSEVLPAAQVTLAATDPQSWRKYSDLQIVGSLTTWVAYLEDGRWRARALAAPVYLGMLALAVLLHSLFKMRLLFGSEEKRRLLSAYYNADLVLSCGGGNFYAHSPLSPFFIWSLLALSLAVGLGKRVVMLPQSVGPIEGRLQRRMSSFVFDRVETMLLRERRSKDFVQNVLRLKKRPIVLPDLAFGPTPTTAPPATFREREAGPRIGVTVIDRAAQVESFSRQEVYESAVALALVRLHRERGVGIYLFSQCNGPNLAHDDRRAVRRMIRRLQLQRVSAVVLDTFDDAMALKAAYAHMDCLIGSRMHSGILALSSSVPVVLIGYQPKTCGIMESMGLERYCCDIEAVTHDWLYERVCRVFENKKEIEWLIAARYAETQARLREWVRYLG